MRVIEISTPGGPEGLVLAERSTPQVSDHSVLIRVEAAGVNRPDILQRMGHYPPPPGASDIPGLEVAGTVEARGNAVTDLSVGDSVCALVPGGGYADYCVADARSCLPIPQRLTMEEAAGIPETFFTVWHTVFERGLLENGEWLLVHGGSSGIGSTAIQLAKAFGAKVITTVGSDKKVDFCTELGADIAVNYKTDDFVEKALEATGGNGVDVVLDMVGGDYTARNILCMNAQGRHVSIAFQRGMEASVNIMKVMQKRLTLTGSTLRSQSAEEKSVIAESLALFVWPLLETGEVKPVIDTIFPITEAASAHALMESSAHMGKIILKM